jgi:hypothetical protein
MGINSIFVFVRVILVFIGVVLVFIRAVLIFIRHYPSVAPIKDVYIENEGLKFYNWNAAMNTKTKAELPKAKAEY